LHAGTGIKDIAVSKALIRSADFVGRKLAMLYESCQLGLGLSI